MFHRKDVGSFTRSCIESFDGYTLNNSDDVLIHSDRRFRHRLSCYVVTIERLCKEVQNRGQIKAFPWHINQPFNDSYSFANNVLSKQLHMSNKATEHAERNASLSHTFSSMHGSDTKPGPCFFFFLFFSLAFNRIAHVHLKRKSNSRV